MPNASQTELNQRIADGDRLARRNALVLAASMALAGANATIVISTGSLMGKMLAPSAALATLPVTTFVLGTALFTYPASNFMKLVGRRAGFMIGGLLGVLSGIMAAAAVWFASFWLFALATGISGAYQSFIVLSRYAAADTASESFRPKAVAWVMLGGIAAAIIGPQLVIFTKDMFPPMMFIATYLGQATLSLLAIGVVSRFRDAPVLTAAAAGSTRHLGEILKNPRFVVAVLCGMVGQSMMNMVMTATPIAMIGCGLSVTESTLGIQWHVLAMYGPGFVTGPLVVRYGKGRVLLCGLALLACAAFINLSGITLAHFWGSLIVLGLGWNLTFVAATSLVLDCHSPAERGTVQGFTDFCIFGATTIASLMAGYLYDTIGWAAVNWTLVPVTAACAIAVISTGLLQRQPKAA